MNSLPERRLALSIVCVGLLATIACRPTFAADNDKEVLEANQAFDQAVAKHVTIALGKFLDADFTWTTKDGQTLARAQVLQHMPAPIIDHNADPEMQPATPAHSEPAAMVYERTYGDIGIAQEFRRRDYVLHVWVKRPAGWHVLVYQEVQLLGAPPASSPGASTDCENPCRSVPFQPKTEAERQVITAYQNVERAVTAHDSAAWGAHIADEFFAVTSNSNGPLDKKTRMAGLDHQTTGGIAQFPLVSARMFQFGQAMIMTSLQKPDEGKPIHVTRVWIERDGNWLEAYSYQTTISTN